MPRLLVLLLIAGLCAPAAWSAGRLNVLLIMSDDLNNDLGTYGHPMVKSPNLDRLAERGVRFDRAYTQYPQCNSSRASMMTGMYIDQIQVRNNGTHFRKAVPNTTTLAELFRKNGYFSARVGKIYHYGVPGQIGTDGMDDPQSWDEVVNPKGRDKDDEGLVYSIDYKTNNMGGTVSWLAAGGTDAEQTDGIGALQCARLLREHKDEPFFIAMGFYRPHTPYVAPKKYFDMYPIEEIRSPAEPVTDLLGVPYPAWMDRAYQLGMDELTKRQAIQAYWASITFMDAQLGVVLDEVESLGLDKNTVIIFVSDHGYHMGEHKLWQKTTLYENSARVPLVVSAPGFEGTRGKASGAVTEMIDIYRTVADLCGLEAPKYVMGRSLRSQLEDVSSPGHRAALTTLDAADRVNRPPLWPRTIGFTIRTERYRYTEWGGGKLGVELYDHEADPKEFVNLALAPHMQEKVKELGALLAEREEESKTTPSIPPSR